MVFGDCRYPIVNAMEYLRVKVYKTEVELKSNVNVI